MNASDNRRSFVLAPAGRGRSHCRTPLAITRCAAYTGWLLLSPAFLLVFVLVAGMVLIAGYSLHELDTSTYRLKADYTLDNYAAIAGQAGLLEDRRPQPAGGG